MKIQILGKGCPKCKKLEENTIIAAKELNLEYDIEKVQEITKIVEMGVTITPALAIDGKVLISGQVLSPEAIKKILKEHLNL
ncbi:MAG: thioredoxin family protein [candidate division WOR-3 bacterium]|jgi:small redox-active disulfide protein 2